MNNLSRPFTVRYIPFTQSIEVLDSFTSTNNLIQVRYYSLWMTSSRVQLEHLTANAKVATVLDSNPASSDTVESEGRQMKQC
jgi:hypothetical protein